MREQNGWSKAEDRTILCSWPDLSISATKIAGELPGRTKTQVIRRAHCLGLPNRHRPISEGTERWTAEEKETLRRMTVGGAEREEIAAVLPGRTDGAIIRKQRVMKLVTSRPKMTAFHLPAGALPRRMSGEPCCFPIGEPRTPAFRYCDEPALSGSAYCEEHDDLTHIRVPQADPAAAFI